MYENTIETLQNGLMMNLNIDDDDKTIILHNTLATFFIAIERVVVNTVKGVSNLHARFSVSLEPSRRLLYCRKLSDASITALVLIMWNTVMSPDQFASRGSPKTV